MARGRAWKLKLNPKAMSVLDGSAARGLALGAEHVLGEANKRIPLEEGTLEKSGSTSVDEANLQAAISYDTPYAVKQHEVPMNHDGGRTHKWLENAMNAEKDTVLEIIAKAIRKEI
jgi:hypothetical protein